MTEIRKKAGWRSALFGTIEGHRRQAFSWGQHDCCIFTADCILAMTGVDLAEDFRGKYRTQAEATALLASLGFEDHVALAAAHFEEIHPSSARYGDVAAVPSGNGGYGLGIVVGPAVAVFTEAGVGSVPFAEAERAFRVS